MLVGSWSSSTIAFKETTNGVVTANSTLTLGGFLSITFNSSNTFQRDIPLDSTVVETGTYKTIGSKLILKYNSDNVVESYTSEYVLSENTLITTETTTEMSDKDVIVTEDKFTYTRK